MAKFTGIRTASTIHPDFSGFPALSAWKQCILILRVGVSSCEKHGSYWRAWVSKLRSNMPGAWTTVKANMTKIIFKGP